MISTIEIDPVLLHDIKNLAIEVQNLKENQEQLRLMMDDAIDIQTGKIKIPHRCPCCNGTTYDDQGDLCLPCDGRGIVWG